MKALVIAGVLAAASAARAAPWSIEVPSGFTEQPGVAEGQLGKLRSLASTVSADAQVYLSADSQVQLTRLAWESRLDETPSRASLEEMERGVLAGSTKHVTKHVMDEHHFVGDQLVAEQVDEVGEARLHQRRMYSADKRGIVHILNVLCAGRGEQLKACETALTTMQLTLPDQAALPATSPSKGPDLAYLLGQITGVVLVVVLVIWWIKRRKKQ